MTRNRVHRLAAVACAAVALVSGIALAQGASSSTLVGTVMDAATKQPVADVVVTATSPNLQGEQVVVTDPTGQYRIPQLPGGAYTLRFEKESYKPFSRGDIQLRLNQTIRLNVDLLPEALKAEEIVVVGRAPTIDVASSRTGVSVGAEFTRNLAVVRPGTRGAAARSFESLADVAPGANVDAYGVSLSGTTSPENAFIVDGLATGSPSLGTLGSPLSLEFVQEVNVITGGFMPEFGRSTGGVMTVVTKSGSNEFHGSVFGNLTPGALEGRPTTVRAEGTVIQTVQHLWNQGDFGADLGGPIMKDKLWFYVGVAPSFTRRSLDRSFNRLQVDAAGNPMKDENGIFTLTSPIEGTATRYFADQRSLQYIGKLTYLINPNHTLTLSVSGAPNASGGNGTYAYNLDSGDIEVTNINGTYEALAHRNSQDSRDASLKLASSFMDKRVLLDVTVGWHHQNNSSLPVDGSGIGNSTGLSGVPQFTLRRTSGYPIGSLESLPDPSACVGSRADGTPINLCPVSSYLLGGPGFITAVDLDRYQANAIGTFFFNAKGHHVLKAGLDAELIRDFDTRAVSGGYFFRENTAGTLFQDFREYGYLTGPDQLVIRPSVPTVTSANAFGVFLQDSWNVLDLVSLNAGVRYDTQTIYGGNGQVAFTLPNQVSPRIGVVWDPTQQGRAKVFGNYARFYQNALLGMVSSQFTNNIRMQANRSRAPINGGPGCDPLTQSAPYSECLDPRNLVTLSSVGQAYPEEPSQKYQPSFAINSPVEPGLQPQSSDELVFGGEYEVLANARAGASYTKRYMNEVIEDMSRNEATNYFIGNPGRGMASDFPRAKRDYDAVTVYFNKAFADLWLAQVSYTWSYLRGNYSGLFRPETGQLAPNITSDFDLASLTINRDGPLPLDRTHSFKIYGAKEFPLTNGASVNLGLTYRVLSGAPLNVLGAHPIYDRGLTFILPRGSGGRLPPVHNVDAHLGLNYRLSKDSVATLSVDAFNLFNFQTVTARDENYTFENATPIVDGKLEQLPEVTVVNGTRPVIQNPNYGNPTAYQAPRSIRFGARVTF